MTFFWKTALLFTALSSGWSTANATPMEELGADLGQPEWNWTSGGDAPWSTQSEVSYDGQPAAQAGPILDGESSWLEVTVDGPGILTFAWKVSSEWHHDALRFTIDGADEIRISGETGWDERRVELSPGSNVLRWAYTKTDWVSHHEDSAWLADVQWDPITNYVQLYTELDGLGPAAQEYSVTVESDSNWSVIAQPDWLTVIPDQGSGNGSATIHVTENRGIAARRGTVVFGNGAHTLTQRAHAQPRLGLAAFEATPDGTRLVDFLAEPGVRYSAQTSRDLNDWRNVDILVDGSFTPFVEVYELEEIQIEVHRLGETATSEEGSQAELWRVHAAVPPKDFSLIPSGAFAMGDSHAESELWMADSGPVHPVWTRSFYIAPTPVTYGEWKEVYDWAIQNGYDFDGSGQRGSDANWEALPDSPENNRHPVVNITWHDAIKWCNAKSEMTDNVPAYYTDSAHEEVYRTGRQDLDRAHVSWNAPGYRLPREAEWEKAARGGLAKKRWPWGDESIDGTRANYINDAGGQGTTAGDLYPPNPYELYDMAGNVWEWVWDWHDDHWFRERAENESQWPGGPAEGFLRVARGGSWDSPAEFCRTAHRVGIPPDAPSALHGFRLVFGDIVGSRAPPPIEADPPTTDGDPPLPPDEPPSDEPPPENP